MVSGDEAADMYTTHGFPPELFETLAAEHNFTFDWARLSATRWSSTARSRAADKQVELFKTGPLDALKKAMHGTRVPRLRNDRGRRPESSGIIAQDKLCDQVDEVGHEQPIAVVLDQTPFYGESGGQVGDTGEIRRPTASASK